MSSPAVVDSIDNSDLASTRWWRDLAARAGRNAIQVLLPIVVLAATTGNVRGLDWANLLTATAIAVAVTVARALSGVRVATGTSWPLEAVDRAVAAAASALLALVTVTGFDVVHADWGAIVTAVFGSAVLAVVAMVTNRPQPPAPTEPPVVSVPPVPDGPGRDDIDPTPGPFIDEKPIDPTSFTD